MKKNFCVEFRNNKTINEWFYYVSIVRYTCTKLSYILL